MSSHGARGLQSALVLRVVALSTFSLQKHRCNEPGQDYYVYACTEGFPRENMDLAGFVRDACSNWLQ